MDESLDKAFAALSDPTRRAILLRLRNGEASVAELAVPFAMSQPAISRHLKVLEDAGLIETLKSGQSRPRRLRQGGMDAPQAFVQDMAAYWPDQFDRLEAYLGKTSDQETER